jgi:alpha-beta hydrolase superfamily lysophospholipase
MRVMALTCAALAVIALAHLVRCWLVADRLSRPERHQLSLTPRDFDLAFQRVEFQSVEDSLSLRGWWMPSSGSQQSVILVHGRNSNRSGFDSKDGSDGDLLRQAAGLVDRGYNVLSFDLRGHGESAGKRYSLGPHESLDVLGAVAYVRGRGDAGDKIFLLCHSMGAATCLLAAPKTMDVAAIVADSGYAELTDLLLVELPRASGLPDFFNPGILWMGKLLFGIDVSSAAPIRSVGEIEAPVLLIHSESDTIVPFDHSLRLWRTLGQTPDTLWLVNGPPHNRVFESDPETYLERITNFYQAATLIWPCRARFFKNVENHSRSPIWR